MGSQGNTDWLLECSLIDDMHVSSGYCPPQDGNGFHWQSPGFQGSSGASVDMNGNSVDSDGLNESDSRKRVRPESSTRSASKACREKMRREKLNDKFLELGSILEPRKPPKMDKAAIFSDAVRMLNQLRTEAQKLKDSNESLHEKILELKSEKNELRDEKQRLKAEKENLEQQIKAMSMPPSFLPHPQVMPAPFIAPGPVTVSKLMIPYISYLGVMFSFQPTAKVDDKNELPPAA